MPAHIPARPDLSSLDDRELVANLGNILARERGALVEGLWHLVEIEDRRLHLAEGHSSIFVYCNKKLRLSDGCAYRRSRAVKLFRRFPLVAQYLADGRLSLTKLVLIEELLTDDNLVELLDRASAGTQKEVERLVATAKPKPDVPDSVRKIPVRVPTPAMTLPPIPAQTTPAAVSSAMPTLSAPTAPLFTLTSSSPPKRHDKISPLSAATTEIDFTVRREFLDLLEQATSLLSRKFPKGGLEDVLGECLRIAIPVLLKNRIGVGGSSKRAQAADARTSRAEVPANSSQSAGTESTAATSTTGTESTRTSTIEVPHLRPAASTSRGEVASSRASTTEVPYLRSTVPASRGEFASARTSTIEVPRHRPAASPESSGTSTTEVPPSAHRSRYIPREVAHAVWNRDGGSCVFEGPDGNRCGSTWNVEIDHIEPFALGGEATEDNLRLLCAPHNDYWRRHFFGPNAFSGDPEAAEH